MDAAMHTHAYRSHERGAAGRCMVGATHAAGAGRDVHGQSAWHLTAFFVQLFACEVDAEAGAAGAAGGAGIGGDGHDREFRIVREEYCAPAGYSGGSPQSPHPPDALTAAEVRACMPTGIGP